jgi:hypothetical protein
VRPEVRQVAGETLLIKIEGEPGDDLEEIEQQQIQLRAELLELDVDSVETVAGDEAPEGTKAVDLAAVGALLVNLGPAALAAVTGALQAWVNRTGNRTITMKMGDGEEFTFTGGSDEDYRRLVDAWLARQQQRLADG